MPETRILLLRHAETAAPDRLHGAESDIGLGPRGFRQAKAVALRLAGERPDILVSSAMRRAMETAAPIASQCGLAIEIEPDLHERKMGAMSGLSREEAIPTHRETMKQWKLGALDYAPAGCESYLDMRERVMPIFERISKRAMGKTAVIVAHGMVIRVILTTLFAEPGPEGIDHVKIDNVAINDLRWNGSIWQALALNQTIGDDLDTFAW